MIEEKITGARSFVLTLLSALSSALIIGMFIFLLNMRVDFAVLLDHDKQHIEAMDKMQNQVNIYSLKIQDLEEKHISEDAVLGQMRSEIDDLKQRK